MRRKALFILWFSTPDSRPTALDKKLGQLNPTETRDFLLLRDKMNKRVGFAEIELDKNETPMDALRREKGYIDSAITSPWQQLDNFRHRGMEVIVGHIGVGRNQREADLNDPSDEFPFVVSWENKAWLLRQAEDKFLNDVTRYALSRPALAGFVEHSWQQPVAA